MMGKTEDYFGLRPFYNLKSQPAASFEGSNAIDQRKEGSLRYRINTQPLASSDHGIENTVTFSI